MRSSGQFCWALANDSLVKSSNVRVLIHIASRGCKARMIGRDEKQFNCWPRPQSEGGSRRRRQVSTSRWQSMPAQITMPRLRSRLVTVPVFFIARAYRDKTAGRRPAPIHGVPRGRPHCLRVGVHRTGAGEMGILSTPRLSRAGWRRLSCSEPVVPACAGCCFLRW